MQWATVSKIYGEEFFVVVRTLTMPWGTVYCWIELVLKHSDTSYRLAGNGFFCAIEEHFDDAYGKACKQIAAALGEFDDR